MKHNRFERIDIESDQWTGRNHAKYKIRSYKRLNSLKLLKQVNSLYDTREPAIRTKSTLHLEILRWWEVPRRHYSNGWKYRSRFPKQYLRNRLK